MREISDSGDAKTFVHHVDKLRNSPCRKKGIFREKEGELNPSDERLFHQQKFPSKARAKTKEQNESSKRSKAS